MTLLTVLTLVDASSSGSEQPICSIFQDVSAVASCPPGPGGPEGPGGPAGPVVPVVPFVPFLAMARVTACSIIAAMMLSCC